jgi:hypothetical protein
MPTLRGRIKRASQDVASVIRNPPFAPLRHYYSPLTEPADGVRAAGWAAKTDSPAGVHVDDAKMARLAQTLGPMWADLPQDARYKQASMFSLGDAAIYHSMLRHFKPSQVIEVGSGFSTAVVLDTAEAFDLPTTIQCIEPYPERLHSLLRHTDDVPLLQQIVQDVPLSTYESLTAGDFLFIDSTHVVKAGSDVVWTTLHVLPGLAPGVIVHIHDMFWPFEYRDEWLMRPRDWNEIYLIHAFLSGNPDWEVLFFNDHIWQNHADIVAANLPAAAGQRPGGLWLRKVR